jgi:hypothetical protein
MAKTGGALDRLCAKHGLGAPHLTIPIMKVIGSHNATTEEEVIQLIAQHDGKFCRDCRSKGNGTIKDWAEVMYETQKTDEEWRKKNNFKEEYPFSRDECREWFRQLFVVAPLVGIRFEKMCFEELKTWVLPPYIVREADSHTDIRYGVDLEIGQIEGRSYNRSFETFSPMIGIQVKSKVYIKARSNVKKGLRNRQRKYGRPVRFMYYDEDKDGLFEANKLRENLHSDYPYAFRKAPTQG